MRTRNPSESSVKSTDSGCREREGEKLSPNGKAGDSLSPGSEGSVQNENGKELRYCVACEA